MNDQSRARLSAFASLHWYDEVIKFVFNFVTKTSELLLAIGVVISTANFLTDGDVMRGHQVLSDAWSWAQAVAIDSSLGIVFMNAFQAVRERDKVKAVIFFTLTLLLAIVAGLITHFDAFGHAAGLPVTDKRISGIIPLWVMTALRAVAVIGFLLSSRLKHVSFAALRQEWVQGAQETVRHSAPRSELISPQIDYSALATAIVGAMRQTGAIQRINVIEEKPVTLPASNIGTNSTLRPESEVVSAQNADAIVQQSIVQKSQRNSSQEEPASVKIARAYEAVSAERAGQQESKLISARELAKRANVRRSTCSDWLQQNHIAHVDAHTQLRVKLERKDDGSDKSGLQSVAQYQEQDAEKKPAGTENLHNSTPMYARNSDS